MSMWIVIWKICLVAGVTLFAVVSVLVTVGGAWDIRRLIERLRDMDQSD